MIIKCLNCGGALQFDPVTQKMVCNFCISSFDPETVGFRPETKGEKEMAASNEPATPQQPQPNDIPEYADEETSELSRLKNANTTYIDYSIYNCSACGAQVSLNGVESATFCVYCGQPTIVLDRIIKDRAPERIIPFSITKERAIQKIKDHFSKGSFIPKDVMECKPECVRGIYIPYWLIDMNYEAQVLFRAKINRNNNTETVYHYRWGKSHMTSLTIDASKQLANSVANRLDPYNLDALKPFDVSYLSGYYADCGDLSDKEIKEQAEVRAMTLFNNKLKRKVHSEGSSNVSIHDQRFRATFNKMEYVMLPAWFMTFRYDNRSYTVLVNGQTGKVTGASPYDKPAAILLGVVMFIVLAFILASIAFSLGEESVDAFYLFGLLCLGAFGVFKLGRDKLYRFKKSITLFRSDSLLNFVSDRQGGDR